VKIQSLLSILGDSLKNFLPSRRKAAAVGIAVATLLGAGAVVAPGAQAAVACNYSSCKGLEPVKAGCNDGVTIFYLHNGGEVRWSNWCQAMWVRASASIMRQQANSFRATMTDYYVNSSGYWPQYTSYYQYGSGGNADFAWTAMSPMGTNELAQVTAFDASSGYINTVKVGP
jgi:hypothetical protein